LTSTGYIELDSQVFGVYVGLLRFPVAGFRWSSAFQPNHLSNRKHNPSWGPWLVPVEGPGATGSASYLEQRYPVFTDRRSAVLHQRFIRLARFRPWQLQEPILDFANRFGWLGSHAERWLLEPRWERAHSNLDWPRGEPFALWRDAIYETATLVALWNLMHDNRRGELEKYLVASGSPRRVGIFAAWHEGRLTTSRDFEGCDWRPVTYDGEPEPVAVEGTGLGDGRFHSFPDIAGQRPDVLTVTRLHLYDRISEKLHGAASPVLAPERQSGEALLLHPHSLLAAIYLYFANELGGRRAPSVPCGNPKCDLTIDPRHGRLYCDARCRDQARYYRDPRKRRQPRSPSRNFDDNFDDNSS
jgi:hypothetical protein